MSTAHEAGAKDALRRLLRRPHGGELLQIAERSISTGKWSFEFLSAVGYSGETTREAPEQLFITAWIHNKLMTGELLTVMVRADGPPRADCLREENNARLRALADPFRASVSLTQHYADSDGDLEWTEPVMGSQTVWPDDDHPREQWVYVEPFSVPLEIGTTKPTRTAWHINEGRGIARWPYDTDWITIYVAPDGVTPGFTETLVRPMMDLR